MNKFSTSLAMTLLFLALPLSGCSIVGHLDQLSVMSEYSKEKDAQNKVVNATNKDYEALLAILESGKIKDYKVSSDVLRDFGEPISRVKFDTVQGPQEQWLYRYPIPHKAKNKVYLYFDAQGQLVNYVKEEIQWH